MIDIVCPKGNEELFFSTAKALGIKALVLWYAKEDKKALETALSLGKKEGIAVYFAFPNPCKSADIVMVGKAGRKEFEKRPDLVYELELVAEKDYLTNPNSGLDQVLAAIAREKNIAIGFSFASVLHAKNRMQLLQRIKQNIRLCRKYQLQMAIFSHATDPLEMRNLQDLRSFYAVLGMNPGEGKAALESLGKLLARKARAAKGLIIADGVEKIE